MVVGVLVEISNKNVDKLFDYYVKDELQKDIKIGIRVEVPFGKQKLEGFVLEIKDNKTTDKDLRTVEKIIDDEIVLNEELLSLGKIMQQDLLATLISCYQVMLPKALKAKKGNKTAIKYDTFYTLNKKYNESKLNEKQREIIKLFDKKSEIEKKDIINISSSSLKTLIKNNVLNEIKKEHFRVKYEEKEVEKKTLTNDQSKAVEEITSHVDNYLLYGVTGSGKTEVYMEIIDYYLKIGKQSIVLVPEISLTPQMINRFQKRFGKNIAALHSGLSNSEKYDEWRRIVRGEVSIVIGARSAVFAPLNNLGVIIIDEEHSSSYKQSDKNPKYHARDIAMIRGNTHNCSVVLGSATPSLESMARASKNVYKLIELPHRVNNKKLPEVEIIDMNMEVKQKNNYFSKRLLDKIKETLEKKEQIILFLNRRGYSTFITCKNCGFTFKCPHCDITLTYHKSSETLRCHYCGYGEKVFKKCPSCHENALNNLGFGTQKIEEELGKIFPNSKIVRMDYDTTSKKGKHEEIIKKFQNREYDILLGTQMVTKGLDFDYVTLVGVINADTSLNIPDFHSSEVTFSLLNQVAGRSGRSTLPGSVIIQSFNPNHYAITYTKDHDYLSFYKYEMNIRRTLKYPPYFYICVLKIIGKNPKYLLEESLKVKKILEKYLTDTIILGPSSASVFKINEIFRYNIILKYKSKEKIMNILKELLNHYQNTNRLKIDIDFNPSQIS